MSSSEKEKHDRIQQFIEYFEGKVPNPDQEPKRFRFCVMMFEHAQKMKRYTANVQTKSN